MYPIGRLPYGLTSLRRDPTGFRYIAEVSTDPDRPSIPVKLLDFADVFSEELSEELAPRIEYNYTINIELGKVPLYLPIYNMS